MEKFNHENFVVHFESALNNKEIGKEFKNFLKSEFNERFFLSFNFSEPWTFLEELKKLEKMKETKEIVKKTIEIIEMFLLDGAECEINVSGKLKQDILKQCDFQKKTSFQCKFQVSPTELFQEIKKTVEVELFHDSWKRFVRTNAIKSIIQKHQSDSSICSPNLTKSFNYQEEYFDHPFIFDQDFTFAKMLLKDNFNWEVSFDESLIFVSLLEKRTK
jgi:hypothetical protein